MTNKYRDLERFYFSILSFFDLSAWSVSSEKRANACPAICDQLLSLKTRMSQYVEPSARFPAPLSRHRPDGYVRGDLVTVCSSTLFKVTIFEAPMRDYAYGHVSKHRSQIGIESTYNKCEHVIACQRCRRSCPSSAHFIKRSQ